MASQAQSTLMIGANASGAIGELTRMNRFFSTWVGGIESTSRKAGSALIGFGAATTIAGSSIQGATRGISNAFLDTIKTGMGFESAMSRSIGVFVDGVENAAALQKTAVTVGEEYALSNIEAAEALEILGKAGFTSEEAINSLGSIVKFAEGNQIDLAKATEIVAVQFKQFGKEGVSVEQITGAMSGAALAALANVEDLGMSFAHMGSIMAGLGVPYETAVTMLAAMSDRGIDAAKAATALRGLMIRSVVPTRQASDEWKRLGINIYEYANTSEASLMSVKQLDNALADMRKSMPDDQIKTLAIGALESLGISAVNAEGDVLGLNDMLGILRNEFLKVGLDNPEALAQVDAAFASMGINVTDLGKSLKDPIGLFQELRDKISGYDETTKNAILTTLFTQTGLNAANAIIGMSAEEWANYSEAVANGSETLDMLMTRVQGTFPYMVEQFKGNVETLKTMIYDGIRPTLIQLIELFGRIVQSLKDADPGVKKFIAALGGIAVVLATVVGPAVIFIGLMALALQTLLVAAAPLLIILAALGLVFLSLQKRLGELRKAVQPAIDAFAALKKEFAGGATESELGWLDKITKLIGDVLIAAIEHLARTFQVLVDILITIRQALNGTWESGEGIHPLVNTIGTLVVFFKNLWDIIKGGREAFDKNTEGASLLFKVFAMLVVILSELVGKVISLGVAFFNSDIGQSVKKYAGFVAIALTLTAVFASLTSGVLGFAASMTRLALAGPIRGLSIFNGLLKSMGLGFVGASKEKDKHIKNQKVLESQTQRSGAAIAWLTKKFNELIGQRVVTGFNKINTALGNMVKSVLKAPFNVMAVGLKTLNSALISMSKTFTDGNGTARRFLDTIYYGALDAGQALSSLPSKVGNKIQTIKQEFVQTGKNVLPDLKDKTVKITQQLLQEGTNLYSLMKDKTITITQKLVQVGKEVGDKGIDASKQANSAASGMASAIGAAAATQAPRIAQGLAGLWSMAMPLVLPLLANPIALLVAGAIALIIIAITKPEWLVQVGQGIAWLFTTGIPFALGFITGAALEIGVQVILLLIKGLQIAAQASIFLVAGALAVLFAPAALIGKLAPILISGFFAIIQHVLVALPLMLATLAVRFFAFLVTSFFQGITTAIGVLSTLFFTMPMQLLSALGSALSTLGTSGGTLFKQIITGDWGGAIQTALSMLKLIFIQLPQQLFSIIMANFGSVFTQIGTYLSTVFNNFGQFLSGAWASVSAWGAQLLTIFSGIWSQISAVLSGAWASISSTFSNALNGLLNIVAPIFYGIKNVVVDAIGGLANIISSVFNGIKSFISNFASSFMEGFNTAFGGDAWGRIKDQISSSWDAIKETFTTVKDAIIDTVKDIPSDVATFFVELKDEVVEKLGDLIEEAKERGSDLVDAVVTAVSSIVDSVVEFFTTLVSEVGSVLGGWAGEIGGLAGDAVSAFLDAFVSFVNDVITFFTDLVSGVAGTMGSWATDVAQFAIDAVNNFLDAFVTFVSDVVQFYTTLVTDIWNVLNPIPGEMLTKGTEIVQGLINGIVSLILVIVGTMQGIVSTIKGGIPNPLTLLYSIGVDVVQGFIDGLKSMASSVLGAVDGVFGGVPGRIAGKFGINSPAKVIIPIGKAISEGFVVGLRQTSGLVSKGVDGIVSNTIHGLTSGFLIASPSQVMIDIAHQLIDGLIVGMDEKQIELAKTIADTVKAVVDGMSALLDFGDKLSGTTIIPIQPATLNALASEIIKILDTLSQALSNWSVEGMEELGKKIDPIKDVVSILGDVLDLMTNMVENAHAFPPAMEKFGQLKLALERALLELQLMFNAFGPALVDNAVSATRNAVSVIDTLSKLVELLALMAKNRNVTDLDFDTFGKLKLALERILMEFDLMFRFLGNDVIANAGAAVENASRISETLLGIVDLLNVLSRNPRVADLDFNIFGQLKLAIERAMLEFQLMFDAFGEGILSSGRKGAETAGEIAESLLSVLEFMSELASIANNSVMEGDALNERVGKLATNAVVLVRAFQQALDTWLNDGGVLSSVEDFSSAVSDTTDAFSDVIDFILALNEAGSSIIVGFNVLTTFANYLSRVSRIFADNFGTLAEAWVSSGGVGENIEIFGEAVGTSFDALTTVLEFLIDAVKINMSTIVVSQTAMKTLAEYLARVAKLVADALADQAKTWDTSVSDAVSAFADAAGESLGLLGDAIDFISSLGDLKGENRRVNVDLFIGQLKTTVAKIIAAVEEVSKRFEAEGMKSLGEFSENAAKSVQLVSDVVDAIESLADLSDVSPGKMARFKDNFLRVLQMVSSLKPAAERYLQDAEAFNEIAQNISDALSGAIGAIESLGEDTEEAFQQAIQTLSSFAKSGGVNGSFVLSIEVQTVGVERLDMLVNAVQRTASSLHTAMERAAQALSSSASDMTEALDGLISALSGAGSRNTSSAAAGKLFAEGFIDGVTQWAKAVNTVMREFAQQALASFVTEVQNTTSSVIQKLDQIFVTPLKNEMRTKWANYLQQASIDIGKAITNGIVDGVASGKSNVINSIVNVAVAGLQAAKQALGVSSPSKEFVEIGKQISIGMARGITQALPEVERAAYGLSQTALHMNSFNALLPAINTGLSANMGNTIGQNSIPSNFMGNSLGVVGQVSVGDIIINSVNDPEYDGTAAGMAVIDAIQSALITRRR